MAIPSPTSEPHDRFGGSGAPVRSTGSPLPHDTSNLFRSSERCDSHENSRTDRRHCRFRGNCRKEDLGHAQYEIDSRGARHQEFVDRRAAVGSGTSCRCSVVLSSAHEEVGRHEDRCPNPQCRGTVREYQTPDRGWIRINVRDQSPCPLSAAQAAHAPPCKERALRDPHPRCPPSQDESYGTKTAPGSTTAPRAI